MTKKCGQLIAQFNFNLDMMTKKLYSIANLIVFSGKYKEHIIEIIRARSNQGFKWLPIRHSKEKRRGELYEIACLWKWKSKWVGDPD